MSPTAPDPDYPIGAWSYRDPERTRPPGPTETHPRETLECTIDGGWYRTALPGETPTGWVTIPWDGETVSYGLVRREPGTPTPAYVAQAGAFAADPTLAGIDAAGAAWRQQDREQAQALAAQIERAEAEVDRARRALEDIQEQTLHAEQYLVQTQERLHTLQLSWRAAGYGRKDGPGE